MRALERSAANGHVRVALAIVTYDSERHLDDCLRSLRACDREGMSLNVIVVDNASRDATAGRVRRDFPEVLLVERPRNEGFAAANNVGIRLAAEWGAEFMYADVYHTVIHVADHG